MLILTNEYATKLMIEAYVHTHHELFLNGCVWQVLPEGGEVDIGKHSRVVLQPATKDIPIGLVGNLAGQAKKVLVLVTSEPETWPEVPSNVRMLRIPSSPVEWFSNLE